MKCQITIRMLEMTTRKTIYKREEKISFRQVNQRLQTENHNLKKKVDNIGLKQLRDEIEDLRIVTKRRKP